MDIEKITWRDGRISYRAVFSSYDEMEGVGFCAHCGDHHYNVEADAKQEECESCGENAVYGSEQLLTMGLAVVQEGESL